MYSPICVGGVGGSGTRLIANILKECGLFLGHDLNESTDTLLFTLLFKDPLFATLTTEEVSSRYNLLKQNLQKQQLNDVQKELLTECVTHRPLHDCEWLKQRAMNANTAPVDNKVQQVWGWKEPNTHVFIDKLLELDPSLKYIHVVRNGLDMAYSSNQNQLKVWGPLFLWRTPEITPEESFNYWCAVHRRIIKIKDSFPERVHILNYDKFAQKHEQELANFFDFIGLRSLNQKMEPALLALFSAPSSIGRAKNEDTSYLTREGADLLERLGFDSF
ncbi:sulfotransferase [Pseudoalteromonas sp. YIC-656]|uniref:sulfotransferase n=1 Tax=Pseudoalteromonas pernae TaxID=3118054 RepID=UPI003241CF72